METETAGSTAYDCDFAIETEDVGEVVELDVGFGGGHGCNCTRMVKLSECWDSQLIRLGPEVQVYWNNLADGSSQEADLIVFWCLYRLPRR